MYKKKNTTVTDREELRTTDGTPLSELGKGLDFETNGISCPDCSHRGYRYRIVSITKKCVCDEKHMRHMKARCRACDGTGRRSLKNGIKVPCGNCKSTGIYVHPTKMVHCWECHNTGIRVLEEQRILCVKCYTCKGTGEIPIANPALPKAAVFALALAC